jgi:hypothetical protein
VFSQQPKSAGESTVDKAFDVRNRTTGIALNLFHFNHVFTSDMSAKVLLDFTTHDIKIILESSLILHPHSTLIIFFVIIFAFFFFENLFYGFF